MEGGLDKIVVKTEDDAITTIKLAFAVLGPLGTFLNETIFEHHSRIKQRRINNFCEEFISFLQQEKPNQINIQNINAEDFGDIFEIIIRKVAQTKSKDKLERFKKILLNKINNPAKEEFSETYIEIICQLHEKQIEILNKHREMELPLDNLKLQYENLKNQPSSQLEVIKKELQDLQYFRKADYYNLREGEYLFYIQDLVSKALLYDIGLGLASSSGQYKAMKVTEYGNGLLNFINN